MSFDLFPNEQTGTLLNAARHPSLQPDSGTWTNFWSGAANYGMRSLAEAGRAIDLAGAAVPVVIDHFTGGTDLEDQYFREHDDIFNRAVDFWTPKPGEVGAAGQIVGQLAGGALQAFVNPALLVGSAQLGTAEDLVRQGVDASTANVVGSIAGASNAVGMRLPFVGKTLAARVLSGAVGNTALGATTEAGSAAVLKAEGYDQQAQQFNPADVRGRVLDALLGAAFGGMEHLHASGETPQLTPSDDAALLVANQQRHMEDTTAPGKPISNVDLTQHVDAMREAIGQLLDGRPVEVDRTIEGMRMQPDEAQAHERAEVQQEAQRITREEAPPVPPLATPESKAHIDGELALLRQARETATQETAPDIDFRIGELEQQQAQIADSLSGTSLAPAVPSTDGAGESAPTPQPVPADLTHARALAVLAENPDLTVPTGRFDPQGNAEHVRVADVMALTDAEAADARATAPNLFRTAAACLLGVL